MGDLFIGASWFLTQGYCEYKLYLEKVLKLKAPDTPEMLSGLMIHKDKENKFLEEAEIGTWEEFLKSEKLTSSREVSLKKRIGDVTGCGVVDEIAIDKDSIMIIDDKPNARPFNSIIMQISAYCFLFKETFASHKKVYALLRDRDSTKVVWQNEFDKEMEMKFLTAFHRMRNILIGEEDPVPTTNPNKCRACKFNNICENSLAR
ncbi:MAG: CRISPR-associated protein Cas4 [Nanoarchaeota archaeon]